MSSWKTDPTKLPEWRERPKCHCGFRTILAVSIDLDRHYGCRYFTCPDLDDDFMPCKWIEWVDEKKPAWPGGYVGEVETKAQYFVKMTQEREAERKLREEHERRVRDDQIRLKGKKDELARRKEQLSLREADIRRQEQELKVREAALNKNKKDAAEPSSGRDRKGKQPRCTQ